MTWHALTFWPVSYRSSLNLSHAQKPSTNELSRVAAQWIYLRFVWQGRQLARSRNIPRSLYLSELGFRAVKNSQAMCIIHQAAGIRCWSKLRAVFCARFIRGNWNTQLESNYQRLLGSQEGKCASLWGGGVWFLCASRVTLSNIAIP